MRVHELGLDKIDTSFVMKLMEQGYATRLTMKDAKGNIKDYIHPALEVTCLLCYTILCIYVYYTMCIYSCMSCYSV
jgi:hypothetical protein